MATRIYTEWVRSAFEGWADWILVAELNGKIAGYGLWRKALETEEKNSLSVAHYDLGAIDPDFRGRGLWTALMLDGMEIARDFAQYLIGPGARQQLSSSAQPTKSRLENFRRQTLVSQMAQLPGGPRAVTEIPRALDF